MLTTKKKRYEDNKGKLRVRHLSSVEMMPALTPGNAPKKRIQPPMAVCSLMDESDEVILDWSLQSIEAAKRTKINMQRNFQNAVRELDYFHYSERFQDKFLRNLSHYDSRSSFGTSIESIHNLQHGESVWSNATEDKTFALKAGGMHRLAERLKAASIKTDAVEKPNVMDKPAKKVVYIPSGFESDLVDFQKYNQIY